MSVINAIKQRRSVGKVTAQPVPTELIQQIIDAGCWAPTHKRTDPWRFVIFSEQGRQRLEQAWLAGAKTDAQREKWQGKVNRAPTIIAVWCAAGRGEKNPPLWEDHAAVAACCQNMLLAAHELGLGAIWRSGSLVDVPAVQQLMAVDGDRFDAQRGDMIIGFLYLGYPDSNFPEPTRTPAPAKITWVSG